ncbi:MAG: DoxX family protein [Nanoarchaeota archaeon]|nr:DoxX family protein [Nanoarchaeota archaeon]
MNLSNWQKYAPILLRLALSFVFLWFGLNQLFDAETFRGYLPEFLLASEYGITIIVLNGIFETVLGILLAIGLFTRVVSFVLGLHLIGIAVGLGYNDIAIRDIGLALATFSITIGGMDTWCVDFRRKKV